jgi:hypothetical protein
MQDFEWRKRMVAQLETREEYLLEKARRREQPLAVAPVAIFWYGSFSGLPQPLRWTVAVTPTRTFPGTEL